MILSWMEEVLCIEQWFRLKVEGCTNWIHADCVDWFVIIQASFLNVIIPLIITHSFIGVNHF